MNIGTALKHVGELRDGLIVIGGALYGAGYATWALYAFTINAGPVSALQVQYFAAGAPAVFLLVTGSAALVLSRRFLSERWPGYLARLATRSRLAIQLLILSVSGVLLVASHLITRYAQHTPTYAVLTATFMILGIAVAALLPQPSHAVGGTTSLLGIAAALLVLTGTLLFIRFVYPTVPQELGGGRPRLAALDVRSADFSAETLMLLDVTNSKPVARTGRVAVINMSADTVLVVMGTGRVRDLPHLEINRSSIVAIAWDTEQPRVR